MSIDDSTSTATNLWYFAIGSMMLPLSYQQRDFHPLDSHPAELHDFRLGFFSASGFAEAILSPGDSMHGVLHKVTPEQMIQLDKVEVGYIRKLGQARPYGPGAEALGKNTVEATVYCRPKKETINKPPMQRYLEILIAGAKHFGVDPKYIQYLQQHENQPRTLPENFVSFGDPPQDAPHYTTVPEATSDGTLYFAMNGKLLEIQYPAGHPHIGFFTHMRQTKGPHFEVGLSQVALDLKYGPVHNWQECTPEHRAYLENNQYRMVEANGDLQYYQVIGTFGVP
jgi:Gamma-glutamyl cyclotransferase, AIG2-like